MTTFKITTDDTLRETVQHGNKNYPFAYYLEDIWQFDFHCINWHWHHDLEFIYVAENTALCLVGMDKISLSKGEGLFINSGILHRFEATSSTIIPNIVFSPNLLSHENTLIYEKYIYPIITSTITYQRFSPDVEWQNEILQLLIQIFTLQNSDNPSELQTLQLLLKLWHLLFHHLNLQSYSSSIQHINHQQAMLQTMMQYIHDHYAYRLTLEAIAASASISKSSALHIFQTFIHVPPVAYLIQYRLIQAAEQLCTTEKSISTIANDTGFTSTGYFCRRFRDFYHMTPNDYRRQH